MNYSVSDTNLKLLTGLPIEIEGFGEIAPLTIKEIIGFGYSKYTESLSMMLLSKESLKNTVLSDVDEKEISGITDLELVIFMATEEVVEILEQGYKLFFRSEEAFVDRENLCVFLKYGEDNFKIIDRENFDNVIRVVKLQNYVEFLDEKDELNPNESEETRRFKERIKKLQEEREKAKRKKNQDDDENSGVTIHEVISSLSTKSNVNELDILNLTIYQLYTKFKRLEVISQYDLDVQSMLAGASGVKLKHWSSRLD